MLLEKIQLEDAEQVLKMVRRHWLIITTELLLVVVAAAAPFIFGGMLLSLPVGELATILAAHLTPAMITYASTGWLILCLLTGFTIWTHYFLDLWIITDRRIILIDQKGFFNRNVSVFRLERLQDIEYYVSGLIATLFNYGTIKAQTASSFESNFKSSGLPDPRGLQAIIQRAMDGRLKELHGHSRSEII